MSNFKSIFAFIIIAAFSMTSCQKEGMSELQTTTEETTATSRNIPAEGIHYINEAAKTQASVETIEAQAQSRTRSIYNIKPGDRYHTSTIGQGNSLDQSNYPDCQRADGSPIFGEFAEPFTGEDMVYYLSVEDIPSLITTHHISIESETDLDLLVFALDRNGYVQECKAISITPGTGNENIDVQLAPGAYIVVVDGYMAGVAGDYTIEVAVSAVSANPPSLIDIDAVSWVNGSFGSLQNIGIGTWYLHNIIPHLGTEVFQEISRTDNSVTIEDIAYNGDMKITKTIKVNFESSMLEVTEIVETSNSVSSSFYTSTIDEVIFAD